MKEKILSLYNKFDLDRVVPHLGNYEDSYCGRVLNEFCYAQLLADLRITGEELLNQLTMLDELGPQVRIITTHPNTGNSLDFGLFRWSLRRHSVMLYPVGENRLRGPFSHPHISDSEEVCLGGFAEAYFNMVTRGLFFDALTMVLKGLETYNGDSAFKAWKAFVRPDLPDQSCYECGCTGLTYAAMEERGVDHEDLEEMGYIELEECQDCGRVLCENCSYSCNECGGIFCCNCTTGCASCGNLFCNDHIFPFNNKYFCESCLEREKEKYCECENCGQRILIGESITCEKCGKCSCSDCAWYTQGTHVCYGCHSKNGGSV